MGRNIRSLLTSRPCWTIRSTTYGTVEPNGEMSVEAPKGILSRCQRTRSYAPVLHKSVSFISCLACLERKQKTNKKPAAKEEALKSISHVTLELIQSLILLANLHVAHLDSTTETLFFSGTPF